MNTSSALQSSKRQVRRLEEEEKIESFSCGDADLDDFIVNEAPHYRNALLAVSYVMEENNTPIAYFIIDNKTGCRFITVDAYRSAIPFYEKNGFLPLQEEDDGSPTRLMYFDLADYKQQLL